MRKKFPYVIILLSFIFVFFHERILMASHYLKYAFFYFVISFFVFLVLNIKDIFLAFKYELLVRDKDAPFLIFILKILSAVYYLMPFFMFAVSFYKYKQSSDIGIVMLLSITIFIALSVRKILRA